MELKGFISYAHADADYFQILKKEVSAQNEMLENLSWDIWTDTEINIGKKWHDTIIESRDNCHFAFLFVSPDFMKSVYIKDFELFYFLDKAKEDAAFLILPILIRSVDFKKVDSLKDFQFFKPTGKEFQIEGGGIYPYSKLFRRNLNGELYIHDQSLADEYHLQLAKSIERSVGATFHNRNKKGKNTKNPSKFSNEIIEEYKKYGIDLGMLSELKKKLVPDIVVDNFEHHFIVDDSDLHQEVIIEGTNFSEDDLAFMPFSADAVVPSTKEDMNISGYDILNSRRLGIICDENDQNQIKKIHVYFQEPVKKGEKFGIKCSFRLPKTMLTVGRDFIISATTFSEELYKYTLTLKFLNNKPSSVRLVIVNEKTERILLEDNDQFVFSIESGKADYINRMRILLLFERK